ncbi:MULTISPECIES: glycosyl hydrolase family 8 [unclassified Fibrobacter]|uniref:glycosyl hydrolase family 8 n=1 Tax=unclassified Fibrobacter TaxID=2634177 RepID=UPI000D6CCF11|nr:MULTISPECIES: glycosyl hydrolase family 8 [unclassified Fibrobacter]PWJ71663.1 endo-1,4-beta-D-glucanase Y [Fibrobacter sp. UWR4]PZW65107.1 endo-1,4-beta-D-glucanase Y [Fibrobacter sp. UWR1]
MNFFTKLSLVGLMSFGLSQAAVNYPFPQMSDYGGNATLLSDKAAASADLKKQFQDWMADMYNEKGDLAGIRSDPGSDCYFSEGVGYGMLLMVYFSDNETSYQPQFDKIWNFYKKFMNKNGLMIWKIGNLSESWDAGNGAALDGDIDAAAALVMAYHQFGDEKYLTDARTLIQSMKKYEFESNGLHMPGDAWGDAAYNRKNPGYFDPAYMPLFAEVDTENAEFWKTTAYDANMKLYESSSDEVKTGLIDDWTDKNGKSEDDYYSYDASRAPWRNAKAVCWHADQRALALDKKMGAFVSTIPASKMSGPVRRESGDLGNDHNSTFVTSLMTSLISDPSYQTKLDEYWKEAVNLGRENYFNQSLKLLNGLLVSGNMPNLAAGGQKVDPSNPTDPTDPADPGLSIAASALPAVFGLKLDGRTLQMTVNGKASVDLISISGSVVKHLWNSDAKNTVEVSLRNLQ